MGKADLTALLENDAQARDFYLALPADVRGRISRDPGDIGSFADLRARAARAAASSRAWRVSGERAGEGLSSRSF